MKEFKLVDQVGEKNNGGNSDQDGIGDVVVEHTEDEFEKQEEHDEEHEELDDELQPATKKTKACLAQTQRKTKSGDQRIATMKKGKKKAKPIAEKVNDTIVVTRRNVTIMNIQHSKHLE